jgi:hypothetical protein
VARNNTVIAAYGTRYDRPGFPFWPMVFDNITIRLLGSDDFSTDAVQQAAVDLSSAARAGAVSIAIGESLPLEHAAAAHDRVEAGTRGRVLLADREAGAIAESGRALAPVMGLGRHRSYARSFPMSGSFGGTRRSAC